MKTVARCYVAGLALAALARLGVVVAGAGREASGARERFLPLPCQGYSPAEGSPPVAALRLLAPPVGRRLRTARRNNLGTPVARRRARAASRSPEQSRATTVRVRRASIARLACRRLLRREVRNDDQREEPVAQRRNS